MQGEKIGYKYKREEKTHCIVQIMVSIQELVETHANTDTMVVG